MSDKTAEAPTSCPACGAVVKWQSSQRFLPNIRVDFECGYAWGCSHNDTWDEKQECTRAFAAAVTLRAELEQARAALDYIASHDYRLNNAKGQLFTMTDIVADMRERARRALAPAPEGAETK